MVEDHAGEIFTEGFVAEDVDFEEDVTFEGAIFQGGDVRFTQSDFCSNGNVSFENASFNNAGDVSFEKVDFENDDDVIFRGVTFANAGDVVFDDADFLNPGGVYFTDIEFENDGVVRFDEAEFTEDVYFDTGFQNPVDVSLKDARFENGNLEIDSFAGVDLEGATFVDCNLRETSFERANLEWATFLRTDLRKTDFTQADLHGVVFDKSAIDNTTNFGVVKSSAGEDREFLSYDFRSYCETDLEKAERTYGILENLGAEVNLSALQIQSYLQRKRMRSHQHLEGISGSLSGIKHGLQFDYSIVSRVVTNHGESPWRVLGMFVGLIVFSAVLYTFNGLGATTFTDNLYYSVLAAVGSVQFASTDGIRVLVGLEAVLGSTLLALLVFVLGRRTTR